VTSQAWPGWRLGCGDRGKESGEREQGWRRREALPGREEGGRGRKEERGVPDTHDKEGLRRHTRTHASTHNTPRTRHRPRAAPPPDDTPNTIGDWVGETLQVPPTGKSASFRSCVRARGLVVRWEWRSTTVGHVFPFPFCTAQAFPFPFEEEAFPFPLWPKLVQWSSSEFK